MSPRPRLVAIGSSCGSVGFPDFFWTVYDEGFAPVPPLERYLAHLSAIERSLNTVRAYAHSLRLWWKFLEMRARAWDSADRGRLGVRPLAFGRLPTT
jgi:hypothetical protein